tara:strand:- start:299 stop:2713 length:2415 start_codon:yes stop_codon:yes gene_type:complete
MALCCVGLRWHVSMLHRYLANAIRRRLRTIGIKSKFIASSGAAAILGHGSTVHNLVDMPISMKKDYTPKWKQEVKRRIGGARLLLLDEISLVSPRLLSALDDRLKAVHENDASFGGLHVIALGDFFQLRVVSDLPLFEGAVQHAAGKVVTLSNALNPRLEENNGINLFCTFRMVNLTTQHRSKDPEHKRLITDIRDPNVMHPLKESDIEKIGELSGEDAKQNCWRSAIFICQTNAERRLYNEFGIRNFAEDVKQPILSWTCPQGGLTTNLDSHERLCGGQSLYGLGYDSKGYFVRGMKVQITQNIAVSQGIANGASAVAISITARGRNTRLKEPIRLPPIETLLPGQEYTIEIPHSVNVVLKKDWEKAVRDHFKWSTSVVVDDQNFDPSVVSVPTACLIALPLVTVYPAAKNKKRKIRWKGHPYTPGFAMTFWKAQGQTYSCNLVIAANKNNSGLALTIAQVYVAISRVKYLKCLRFMPLEYGRASELARLSYPHNLKMWARNYTVGLVDLVVDGCLHVDGRTVDVVCGGGGLTRSLEVYSSSKTLGSTTDEPSTHLRLCSATALHNVTKVIYLNEQHFAHTPTAPLVPCGDGLWKCAGLSNEFYAKELEVMQELEQYKNFLKATVLQRDLRRLCGGLCIRYCQDDKNDSLKQRLLPTWKKARARAARMTMVWHTKENRKKPPPPPDVIKHVARHEWCPNCNRVSRNKFNGISVGDHQQVAGKRLKLTRYCGIVTVDKRPHSRLNKAVAEQLGIWHDQLKRGTKRKTDGVPDAVKRAKIKATKKKTGTKRQGGTVTGNRYKKIK